jgi:23S rRNA (cytosine1962-C5)-methyltransferase
LAILYIDTYEGEEMERIRVDKQAEEAILSGHLWVFSNQVKDRPDGFPAGDIAEITNEKGRFLGVGYYNPRSLIAVRLLSRENIAVDEAFFIGRIQAAMSLRGDNFGESFRIVNSESDFLPGLIIDRYNEHVVLQFLTAGIEKQRDQVMGAVKRMLAPRTIVLRNDGASRADEGIPQYVQMVEGRIEGPLPVKVGPLRFLVDLLSGHKTGFYFDQSENRLLMKEIAPGRRILDLFCYSGGFGLHGLHYGARSVTFVDASAQALDLCRENMKLNGLTGGTFVRSDAFDFLKATHEEYDVVVCDPPSFVKSRKKLKEGEKGYIDINKKALRHISLDGCLLTFSCSHHMKRSRFKDLVRLAAYGFADLYLSRELSQAGDHPILLTIPETDYLKGLMIKVKKRA